MAGGTPPRC
ncbi:hypothetical protein ECFRIK1985_5991, partial [Escherichia coli FRIK1985]